MRRIARGNLARLKSKVIISMRALCRTAWADQIYLRRHLIVWPKPSLAGRINSKVAKILCKDFWVLLAKFLRGIPDTVIGAGGGKMIGFLALGGFFISYDTLIDRAGRVNATGVLIGILEQ